MSESAGKQILILAGLGLISGLLTTLIWMSPVATATSFDDFDLDGGAKLLTPGLLFGLILAVRLRFATTLPLARLLGFVLLVEAGWLAAYFFAINVAEYWDGLAAVGFAAGLIGGFACGLASLLLGRPQSWLPPLLLLTIVGGLAGILLPVDIRPEFLSPLFYVWQAAVAAAIGWVLAKEGTI